MRALDRLSLSTGRVQPEKKNESPTHNLTGAFVYQPLPDAKAYIRLLEILPGHGGRISCSISTHRLSDMMNEYVAISYIWGQSVKIASIQIEEHPLQVTPNAHFALYQMQNHQYSYRIGRPSDQPRYYWIDLICINQSDNEEKASQVAIMHHVFGSAIYVAVCLGPASRSSQRHLQRYVNDQAVPVWRKIRRWTKQYRMKEEMDSLPYFQRLWIIQEFILARRVLLFLGISRGVDSNALYCDKVQWGSLYRLLDLREQFWANGPIPLAHAVATFGDRQCALAHDKLYGLLGISNAMRSLQVDYDRRPWDLIRDFLQTYSSPAEVPVEELKAMWKAVDHLALGFSHHTGFNQDLNQFFHSRLVMNAQSTLEDRSHTSTTFMSFSIDRHDRPPFRVRQEDIVSMSTAMAVLSASANAPSTEVTYKLVYGWRESPLRRIAMIKRGRGWTVHDGFPREGPQSVQYSWPDDTRAGDYALAVSGLGFRLGFVLIIARARSGDSERLDLVGWSIPAGIHDVTISEPEAPQSQSVYSAEGCLCPEHQPNVRYRLVLARDDWLSLCLLYPWDNFERSIMELSLKHGLLSALPITTPECASYVEIIRTTEDVDGIQGKT